MLIYTRDREIIPKTEPLVVAPNIRKSLYSGRWYIVSINLYCGDKLLGDYESYEEALAEMEAISQCNENVYFIGNKSFQKLCRKLEAELRRLMDDA